MNREQAERVLAELGQAPEDSFSLFEAALTCAIHEDPDRDADAARRLAADSVERLKARLKTESPEEALAEAMAGDLGLAGDVMTFEDPANADIISVCERRKAERSARAWSPLRLARA